MSSPEPVELSCRRTGFRTAAAILPGRIGNATVTLVVLIGAGIVLAGTWLVVAGAQSVGTAALYLVAVVLLLLPSVIWIPALVAGSWWAAAGAGQPMLRIADGQVSGRLRPVRSGPGEPGPESPQWWDFVVPASDLRDVRVSWESWLRPALVLDLPAALADELAARPETRTDVAQSVRRLRSPAVWWLGMYEPRSAARSRLESLLSALTAAGAPTASARSAG